MSHDILHDLGTKTTSVQLSGRNEICCSELQDVESIYRDRKNKLEVLKKKIVLLVKFKNKNEQCRYF